MKKIIIEKIGIYNKTIDFSSDEFERYLKQIDPQLIIEMQSSNIYDKSNSYIIRIGIDGSICKNQLDDEIKIILKDGDGIITGSNERSVLIAVYRVLFELGCRWLRPGPDGEVVPYNNLSKLDFNIEVAEAADYRHRAICIEGAVSYEHVYDMINWLPKVGMNGYYVQFRVPYTFFKLWYNHDNNSIIPCEPLIEGDVIDMYKRLTVEIKKRGLFYHAFGHGWTCEMLGIAGIGWEVQKSELPEELKTYVAQLNGKRELCNNIALNTNLCYSKPEVRGKMTDSIVKYCLENDAVDYLHFWLGDGLNNNCECEDCSKMRPSDFYVMMLNELDEKLTKEGLDTKVVFLIYEDLLWEPEVERIKNTERFVLMFAPITRTYLKSLNDINYEATPERSPYIRNKLTMPQSLEENIAYLKKWQEMFNGDSFDYDYHLMWDHMKDPGYYRCSKILHEDMKNLYKIGLNGMVSCQLQRVAFPTCLPMYAMSKALWNRTSDFDDVTFEYFNTSFGEAGQKIKEYLSDLSDLFDGNNPDKFEKIEERITQILPLIENGFSQNYSTRDLYIKASYKYLKHHANFCIYLAEAMKSKAEGDIQDAKLILDDLFEIIRRSEMEIHNVLDVYIYINILRGMIEG